MDCYTKSLILHEKYQGKIAIQSKISVNDQDELSLAYTPGVAAPCMEIQKDEEKAFQYTVKGKLVAIVTDGSAVLGLGNIGPKAALPVMEGKAVLFKSFADIDAFPICLDTQDVAEIVQTVKNIAPVFGGINLEDIAAPRCFEIERKLQEILDIPVFHDDQHGTAIVASAALINALKVTNKQIEGRIVVNGAGAAGTAIIKMLVALGAKNILACDKMGIISSSTYNILNSNMQGLLKITNPEDVSGDLAAALKGADVFIGVSAPGVLKKEMIAAMNKDAIIFALANPLPEILPTEAKLGGAAVVGTGRSDFPNQINNVLAFPGIFKGALRVRAKRITQGMKVAAVHALASVVSAEKLSRDYIIPNPFNQEVVEAVSKAVAAQWLLEKGK